MNRVALLSASWFIWGIAYYLYYPYTSIYASEFIRERLIPLIYIAYTLIGIPSALLSAKVSRFLGMKRSILIFMALSGIGLVIVAIATTLPVLILGFTISSSSLLIALPNYYYYMNNLGKGVISKVWAISILPAVFTPVIGGTIAQLLGIRYVFLTAGLFMTLSGLPVLGLKYEEQSVVFYQSTKKLNPLPGLVIIPISLASPFVFLVTKDMYNLSYITLGVLATMSEVIGMIVVFFSAGKNKLLPIYLILFSLVYLVFFNPLFSLAFGLWEVLIPLAIEEVNGNSVSAYSRMISIQQTFWLIGYFASLLALSVKFSLLISAISSLVLAFIAWKTRNFKIFLDK
ncbi:hypothetical protein SUSAZ_05640 [Sulfolobus acidocaldarius SUSAZ]|nr:hypothetical protein SUSAZ_05640 [Sulfolobus acidocaldarius SUSAZ]